jgi:hypothetical protein
MIGPLERQFTDWLQFERIVPDGRDQLLSDDRGLETEATWPGSR